MSMMIRAIGSVLGNFKTLLMIVVLAAGLSFGYLVFFGGLTIEAAWASIWTWLVMAWGYTKDIGIYVYEFIRDEIVRYTAAEV